MFERVQPEGEENTDLLASTASQCLGQATGMLRISRRRKAMGWMGAFGSFTFRHAYFRVGEGYFIIVEGLTGEKYLAEKSPFPILHRVFTKMIAFSTCQSTALRGVDNVFQAIGIHLRLMGHCFDVFNE